MVHTILRRWHHPHEIKDFFGVLLKLREELLTRVVFQIELHESCRPYEFHCVIAAYLFRLTENRAELENFLMPQLKELIFNRDTKFTQPLSHGVRFGIIAAAGIGALEGLNSIGTANWLGPR